MKNEEKKISRIRLLISGTVPPPYGGMASYYESLLSSTLRYTTDLCFVQTSAQKRLLAKTGDLTIQNIFYTAIDIIRFTKKIKKHKPNISHIGTAYGLSFIKHSFCVVVARLIGSLVLLHPHCSFSVLYSERSNFWKWYFRKIISLCNGVLALSKEWLELKDIMPECSVYYLPNAINTKLYGNIGKERRAEKNREKSLNILYLGYLGKDKGTYDLIMAANQVISEDYRMEFNLVGDELKQNEIEKIKRMIRNRKIQSQVKVHPGAFGKEKEKFFSKANVFVYPSHHEGMPIAVIEAMACGLPILATRTGGLPDMIVEGENGFLITPKKPKILAQALKKIYEEKEVRLNMGEINYKIAKIKYDIESHVDGLIVIYKNVLKKF